MNTKYHAEIYLLECLRSTDDKEKALEKFKSGLPYLIIPDAIRMYTGKRQFSHFEKSKDGEDVSYLKYPIDLKNLDQYEIDHAPKKEVEQDEKCVIGEDTQIDTFRKHNEHLPEEYYNGVLDHLSQDVVFDEFVREEFDCSDKYNNKFKFKGQDMDGQQMRQKVQEINDHGEYILAYILDTRYGIKFNQKWIDENIKATLEDAYPKDLADNTNKYMVMRGDIDKDITDGNYQNLNKGPVNLEEILKMLEDVHHKMSDVRNKDKEKNNIPYAPGE